MHKILEFTIEQTTLTKNELQQTLLEDDKVVSVIDLDEVTLEGTVNEFQVRLEATTNVFGSIDQIPNELEEQEHIILVDKEDVTISDP